ncbi:MAG: hypothetical protein WBJ06_03970 [Candidatus Methanoculleus thermohydrogenotrophicum]
MTASAVNEEKRRMMIVCRILHRMRRSVTRVRLSFSRLRKERDPVMQAPAALFLEVLSLKSGYQEIMKIIKKYSRILLRSLTATAVTLLKPAVIQGMGVVPGSLLLS